MLGTYFWVLLALRKWKGKLRNGHLEPRVIITPFCNHFGKLWPAKCPLPVLVCPQSLGAVPRPPSQSSVDFVSWGSPSPLGMSTSRAAFYPSSLITCSWKLWISAESLLGLKILFPGIEKFSECHLVQIPRWAPPGCFFTHLQFLKILSSMVWELRDREHFPFNENIL